jgi:hypothetical protein
MTKKHLGYFEFSGSKVILDVIPEGGWKLSVWSAFKLEEPEVETFESIDAANRAFEQTTRGIFFQTRLFPFSHSSTQPVLFESDTAFVFSDTDCGSVTLPYSITSYNNYDIRVTNDVAINVKDWPNLKRHSDNISCIRMRLFNTANYRVLFDKVVWDGGVPPRFTQGGYDIVELRSRGDGIVRGMFYLNVPNQEHDTRLLVEDTQ